MLRNIFTIGLRHSSCISLIRNCCHVMSLPIYNKYLLLLARLRQQARATNISFHIISYHPSKKEREMSDIAMLVAEEYERRVKSLKKAAAGAAGGGGGAVEALEIDMASCASLLVSKLKEKKQLVQGVLEPKTQFAIAASNSFFSA